LELWRAFEVLRDGPLRSFEVRGLVAPLDHDGRTAFLAAEAVRDLALLLWGGRPQGAS
jgi:arginase family enzyme